MGRFFSTRFSYRARSKSKGRSAKKVSWLAAFFLFASLFSLYALMVPSASGRWGRSLAEALDWFAGKGAFFLPLGAGYVSFLLLFKGHKHLRPVRIALSIGLYLAAMVFVTLVGQAIWKETLCGALGAQAAQI